MLETSFCTQVRKIRITSKFMGNIFIHKDWLLLGTFAKNRLQLKLTKLYSEKIRKNKIVLCFFSEETTQMSSWKFKTRFLRKSTRVDGSQHFSCNFRTSRSLMLNRQVKFYSKNWTNLLISTCLRMDNKMYWISREGYKVTGLESKIRWKNIT